MASPRVLWLNEYPTLNGGERSYLSVLPGLRAAGFEIIAAAPASGELADALAQQGVTIHPLNFHDRDGQRLPLPTQREQLAAMIREIRPALLHANSLAMGRLSGPVTADLNLPSISHLRDIVGLKQQAIKDLNCHRRLLAVSAATRDFHIAQGLLPDRVDVLYNGVDLQQFAPRPPTGWLHQELGIPRQAMLVGTIGQIILRKGQDTLAAAAAALAAELSDLHYVIIGARYSQKAEAVEFERDLHRRFHDAGLAPRAHFVGVREHLSTLLPELALLVHPARQEPLGRVLLEAAACGLPIIATDVGGTREILPPNPATAIIIPPDNPGALIAAIRTLVLNPARQSSLGSTARQRMEAVFDIHTASACLAHAYTQAMED